MEQRITIITLGVADLERAIRFYQALGWRRSVKEARGVAFFQCGAVALALYPFEALAADAGVPVEASGSGAVAIAHNERSREAVDAVIAEAERAGAEILKPAADTSWGGYAGCFRDPDGHLWEIAWNPHFELDGAGAVTLPD